MRLMLRIILVLCFSSPIFAAGLSFFGPNYSDRFAKLDAKLIQGDLDSAYADLEALKHDGIGNENRAAQFSNEQRLVFFDYVTIANIFSSSNKFMAQNGVFSSTEKTSADIQTLRSAYLEFNSAWGGIVNGLRCSKDLVAKLNSINRQVVQAKNTAELQYVDAENARYRMGQELQERDRQQRITEEAATNALEADQKAKLKADQDKASAEAQAERDAEEAAIDKQEKDRVRAEVEAESALSKKLANVEARAKKQKLSGLYRTHGFGNFLVDCQEGKDDLTSGVGFVFYLGPEANGLINDNWRMVQVVPGWEIYREMKDSGPLFVAIKEGKKLTLEGQKLIGDFYIFRGNRNFVLTGGATRIVQILEPFSFP